MLFLSNAVALGVIFIFTVVSCFSPDTSTFDNYGAKLAANDVLLVESIRSESSFLLRLAPYNYLFTCTLGYNDSNQFIYAVALARQATVNSTIRFVFIGINVQTNVPFIGSQTYTGISTANYTAAINFTRKSVFPCTGWNTNNYRIRDLTQFTYDENDVNSDINFFVVGVEPIGQLAYAFAKGFLLVYNLATNNVSTQFGNITWPDTSFLPRAVDISRSRWIVVLGYVGDSSIKYTPCAHLIDGSKSNLTILDTWFYTSPINTSWQESLTNWDADTIATKYTMAVSINDAKSQVLLGIQITNTIVILDIDQTNNKFRYPSQALSNGKAIGMGKAVGWLNASIAVALVNTYSLSYIWSSSQIFTYNVSMSNNFSVNSIIPNIQQTFAPAFGPILISLVATESGTLMILDSHGSLYIVLPSPIGSVSDSSSKSVSSSIPCIGGTFSGDINIFPCSPCSQGSTTNGLSGQSVCIPCDNDTFCPLGAAFGNISLSSTLLMSLNQARAYPVSPQSVRFDNILMENMFSIRASMTRHCLLVSPLFWAIIVIGLCMIIALIMAILKHCVSHPRGKTVRYSIKCFFKQTDLLGEGELWAGGMASFAILILAIAAYIFSSLYFQRYPIERVNSEATFACDSTLSNAQFSSGLMTRNIPPTDDEVAIFKLLDAQPFTLYVDLINTLFTCSDVTQTQIKDTNLPLSISSCGSANGSLSLATLLPSHGINLQLLLSGTHTVGGLRIGLQGPHDEEHDKTLHTVSTLKDLNFAQVFSVSGHLLTQQPSLTMQLTKVINRTYALEEHGTTQFSALWIPYVSVDVNQIFVDDNEYRYSTSSSTIISIVVSETTFYVLNTQKPITTEPELIFTDLLFTIVCIEIFGLIFIIFKLGILPLVKRLTNYYRRRTALAESPEQKIDLSQTLLHRF